MADLYIKALTNTTTLSAGGKEILMHYFGVLMIFCGYHVLSYFNQFILEGQAINSGIHVNWCG